MRFGSLFSICVILGWNFADNGRCFDSSQKVKALACTGQTYVVVASNQSAEEFSNRAPVDSEGITEPSFPRQTFHKSDQERDRKHGSPEEEHRLAVSLVQGHEWQECPLLPTLWRKVVRSWGGQRGEWQSSICSVASEPERAPGLCRLSSATEVSQTDQGTGTRRLHSEPQAQTESASQGQETTGPASPARCPTNGFSFASSSGTRVEFVDDALADATGCEPSSTSGSRNISCSVFSNATSSITSNETTAGLAEEGSGEVVTRKPRIGEIIDCQGGKERRKRAANCSKRYGTSQKRSTRSVHCKVEPSSKVEDVLVNERSSVAILHNRVSATRVSGHAGDTNCKRCSGFGEAESGDFQGGVPISKGIQTINGGARSHVRRGGSGGSGSSKTSGGTEEFDNLPTRSSQSSRGRNRCGERHKESQAQRSGRRLWHSWWQSFAAFWGARYIVTSEYEYQGLAPLGPKVFQQKWTHSILLEKDFRTEWHARAAAIRLSFECDTISENHNSWKPRAARSNPPFRQVHFAENFSLLCSNHETATCSIFQGSHGEVQKCIQQFQSKPLLEVDPLSKHLAVSISHSGEIDPDEHNLMQFHTRPISCNEPDVPVWYPLTDRGDVPMDAPDLEQDTADSPSDQSNDDFDELEDPQEPDSPEDPAHPPPEDHDRQSALMYHLEDPPIHAMLFWTDFDRLMSEIALHYQIPREELFDSYELNTRPLDIPPGTAPLLVHLANDFPHGANLVLALVDIEVHGNECETHYQTFPDMQRKVIPVPAQLTRDTLLRLARVFDYCKVEHERCLVEVNSAHWLVQNRWPISAQHGDYIRIVVPPPTDCRVGTQEMLNDSHHLSIEDFWGQYYVPSSPEAASGSEHSNVSPSLIASEDIKREFGPQSDSDHDEHSQLQQPFDAQFLMQMPGERSSSSSSPATDLAAQNAQIINSSCLLAFTIEEHETGPVPKWFRGIAIAFGAHAAVEHDDEGPVCYFDTWYADCRTASVTEVSRSLRLDRMLNLWQHDLRHLWRDKIQDGATIHVAWVLPVPPPAPLQRSAGHIIVYQFPEAGLVPFITTIHFNALEAHGTTFACVVEDPIVTPIDLLQRLNLDRVCRGRSCTLHRDATGKTWAMPIQAGEGLRLFIPEFGARAHIDSLSYPKSVALVQTGPAPDTFDISMRLEDHPECIRELHEIWSRSARRGPAGMELILEITTWYLDAEFVPFNDQSRTIVLGEDFFEWEQQIREKWADLADASADISLALVRPTPPGWSIDKVHLLVHQQFESTPSQIGGLVSIYDNAVNRGAPSTHASVLPKALNRQHLLEASNRNLQHEPHCSTWLEGFEIRDSSVLQAVHGQCFSVHIHRPHLQEWDLPLPADEEAAFLQVHIDPLQKHAVTMQPQGHTG